jgi:hypothetical protein
MKEYGAEAEAVLRGAGFDPAVPEVEGYIHARGWKIDPQVDGVGAVQPTRVQLIDRDGEVVGAGRGEEVPQAVLAAFADYLVKTG